MRSLSFASLSIAIVLALGSIGCMQTSAEPESVLGVARSELSLAVRRTRATTIRSTVRAEGITNGEERDRSLHDRPIYGASGSVHRPAVSLLAS